MFYRGRSGCQPTCVRRPALHIRDVWVARPPFCPGRERLPGPVASTVNHWWGRRSGSHLSDKNAPFCLARSRVPCCALAEISMLPSIAEPVLSATVTESERAAGSRRPSSTRRSINHVAAGRRLVSNSRMREPVFLIVVTSCWPPACAALGEVALSTAEPSLCGT